MRRRWDLGYSRTAEMLREKCGCEDKRIGKNKLSVYVVKEFEARDDDYKQKKLKVLEIGAGWGHWLLNINKNKDFAITAVEISETRRKFLTKKLI